VPTLEQPQVTNSLQTMAFSVSVVNRFLHNPGRAHWNAVKRILRYLKGTHNYELKIAPFSFATTASTADRTSRIEGKLRLTGNTDADWGGNLDTFKSTSGYGFFLGAGLISWSSKAPSPTATSSTYAEYIAAYHATAECLWIQSFLKELDLFQPTNPNTLYCDNEASIKIAQYHMVTPRSKHFDTKYHFVREQVANGNINLTFCPGKDNVADIFTKPLPRIKFSRYCLELGLGQHPKTKPESSPTQAL